MEVGDIIFSQLMDWKHGHDELSILEMQCRDVDCHNIP